MSFSKIIYSPKKIWEDKFSLNLYTYIIEDMKNKRLKCWILFINYIISQIWAYFKSIRTKKVYLELLTIHFLEKYLSFLIKYFHKSWFFKFIAVFFAWKNTHCTFLSNEYFNKNFEAFQWVKTLLLIYISSRIPMSWQNKARRFVILSSLDFINLFH